MKEKIIRSIWGIMAIGVFGGITLVILVVYFSLSLPRTSSLADYRLSMPSQILAKDGTVLAELGKEKREIAPFDEIPRIIIEAFLSAEDDNFFEHTGIDYGGILRAMYTNLKAGRVVQGGSTITQQVAKSLLLNRQRSVARKIKDFLLAQRIEKEFTKEEILFLYLNQVYLGGGFYGVKAGFRGYFGKELSEASMAETAMLAGLLVAPTNYSPYTNPEMAKARQAYVLKRMYLTDKITKEEYETALREKIKFKIRKKGKFKAGYFTDWIRQRVIDVIGKKEFLVGGYKVQTTLNWKLQKIAEREILKGAKKIDKRQGFKGPIGHIDTKPEIFVYEKEFRQNAYKKASNYFTINEDFDREYEIKFDEAYFWNLKENQDKWPQKVSLKNLLPGNRKKDPLFRYIKKGSAYEAVVLKVNSKARLIFVGIGGLVGIIPQNNFKWAHRRIVDEKRRFTAPISNPAKILEEGDIVLVQIQDFSVPLTPHIFGPHATTRIRKNIQKERYILCLLDQEPEVQAALVAISPQTSSIVSMVGGTDFSRSQFNRAVQSLRQPGSSFKPIVYAAALENNFNPSSIIIDSPEALGGVDDSLSWKPRNYDGKFKGAMTLRSALEQSRNVPVIKVANKVGVKQIIRFAKRIKFNAKMEQNLGLALGSFGVTLNDIVASYSIFSNGGKISKFKSLLSITDRGGHLMPLEKKEGLFNFAKLAQRVKEKIIKSEKFNTFHENLNDEQVYDKRLAYIMTNLLRGVVLHGTGKKALHVGQYIGGKTGTTSNYVDAWFIGFSSNLVVGVWNGFDDNKTMGWGETGSKAALPIWMNYMKAGLKEYGEYDFTAPLGIVNVLVNKKTGRLANEEDPNPFVEAFVEGTEPSSELASSLSLDKEGEGGGAGGNTGDEETDELLEDDEYYNGQ